MTGNEPSKIPGGGEHVFSWSHGEIKNAFDALDPSEATNAAMQYSNSASVWVQGLETFSRSVLASINAAWEGAAAEAAKQSITTYTTDASKLEPSLTKLSQDIDAAAKSVHSTRNKIPDYADHSWTANIWPPRAAEEERSRNEAEQGARDAMDQSYVRPYATYDSQIPVLPTGLDVSGRSPTDYPGGGSGSGGSGSGSGSGGGSSPSSSGDSSPNGAQTPDAGTSGDTGESGQNSQSTGESSSGGTDPASSSSADPSTGTTPASTASGNPTNTTSAGVGSSSTPGSSSGTGGYGSHGGAGTPGSAGSGGGSAGRSVTGTPSGTGSGTSGTTAAAAAQRGSGSNGMMPGAGAGRGKGDDESIRTTPDYLVNEENTRELLGEQPRTLPGGVIGTAPPESPPARQDDSRRD